MHPHLVRRAASAFLAAGLLFGAGPTAGSAQATGSIRGSVTDAVTARPLSGAQVSVPGTGRGAIANASGQFLILNVPVGAQTVRAEIIGYAAAEMQVDVTEGTPAVADFQLSQQALQLDEIVVTGTAGQTTRRAIGNSVSKVEASTITDNVPVTDVQQLLQARTPGLSLISTGGGAGDGSQIRLRGSGSIEGAYEPVFYVDGIRVASGAQEGQCGSTAHCTNALDFLNPDDIESIEVIRGPAASTLYGADAAGGVIQIFTKKGQAGEGIQWTGSAEYGQNEWHLDTPLTYWLCTPENIADPDVFPGCAGIDPTAPGEDRLLVDDPMGRHPAALRTGDVYNVNLAARGGGDLFNYYISVERGEEQGIFFNNFARRTGGRANFGFVPSDNLDFAVNIGYVRQHIRIPLSNNSSNSILRNGFRGRAGATADPWAEGYRGLGPEQSNMFDLQDRSERFTVGTTLNYNPWTWFQNRLTMGLDANMREATEFYEIDQTGRAPFGSPEDQGLIDIELPETHTWTVDYAGTLTADIGEDYTSAFSAGMQLNARKFESHTTIGEGLVANNLNLVGSAAVTRADQDFEEQTSLGFFVQEQVGWRNRLFGTAAVRIDDNSAFGQDFSLVVYPKAQLSWVVSEESFFEVPWIDQLKLRGAWGQAGNPPDPFTADRTYEANVTTIENVSVNQLSPASFGNPDLKAETGSELELGFESSWFEGRMGVDFTYYNQRTKDALIAVPDPPSSGFNDEHFENVGEIANSGIEVLLTATPIHERNLQWDATVALSTNDNELVSFNGARTEITFGSFATVQKHVEGFPLGGYWAQDVVRDANGEPVLVDGDVQVVPFEEAEYVGPSLPTREIGFTNTLTLFGNLRLFANLDYKGGHYQWCAICSVRSRIDQNTFEVNDPNADPVDVLVLKSLQTKSHISKADFIKLRELSATYSLPDAWAQTFRADRASLSLSGRNLWIWTRYEGNEDPEVNFDSLDDYSRSDYASIPMTRHLAVSLRFAF